MRGWVTSLFLTKLVDNLTRLCAWEVRGLVYMRDLSVPIYYMREHKLESTLWGMHLSKLGNMVFKKYENAALEKSYRTEKSYRALTSTKMCKSLVDLQKNCSPALNSEPKNVATSSQGPLAHVLLLLAALRPLLVGFPSEKSILPYFSSLRGVAILDCEYHSQAGSTRTP